MSSALVIDLNGFGWASVAPTFKLGEGAAPPRLVAPSVSGPKNRST
jgi:hypothetical protein